MITDESSAPVATLLENHRAFLQYLERRVGDRALAEDILQDAFAKVVARPEQAPADEGIVPWFYRTLRNATIDQFRRGGAADRAFGRRSRQSTNCRTSAHDDDARSAQIYVYRSHHVFTRLGRRSHGVPRVGRHRIHQR
ncbi:MAG: hypothetical protein LC753_12100 [Acidobacteria bacterium]|nr:hypothetical protein [Acidobacteriota bacterium]MCA1650978.1 hypothetical protein [Acidobacteriota bacterium]